MSGLSSEDLKEKARSIGEEMMKLRFRHTTGQLEQTSRLELLRKNLARVKTFLASRNWQEGKQG